METKAKASKRDNFVIYLDGINLDDYDDIESTFTTNLMERIADNTKTPKITYDKIPPIFTGLETWPSSTNLHCWYCDFTFNNVPIFIPKTIEFIEASPGSSKPGVKMSTVGNFCTFHCAAAYCMYSFNNLYINNLLYLYYIFTGKATKFITLSHRKISMEKYGGDLTELEYLERVRILVNIYKRDDIDTSNDAIYRDNKLNMTTETSLDCEMDTDMYPWIM